MPIVELTLPHHHYEVRIESGLIRRLGELTRQVAPHERAALLVDAGVAASFGPLAQASLRGAGYQVAAETLPSGEQHKQLETVRRIYDLLLDARHERRSPVVAMGGGVLGDTVGFAAATYLRGVPFVQCPTTLLAMVDASVGGKVGVNVPQGKNLIGSFYQPYLVVIDTDSLGTLPARELRCGLAECVKHAMIRDAGLFEWIDASLESILRLEPAALVELVHRNVRIKAEVVMADEKETGLRAHLNFGHTFAHALEAVQQYGAAGDALHHGEAVALGMVAATRLAVDAGRCEPAILARLVALLERIGLPVRAGAALAASIAEPQALLAAMATDKKVSGGRIHLVLPQRLGAVDIASDVPAARIRRAWQCLLED